MKRLLLITLLLFSLAKIQVFAQGTGTVKGRVLDELGLGLPGASVYLENVNIGAVTDVNGNFVIFNAPSGSQNLIISFIGYNQASQSITINADQVTSIETVTLEPGVTINEEILVLGDRLKGQAKALNQQRTNINVTNIVAADQIGRFPDANIGDAIKRIPGITMQNDQGEARDIIIRGIAPQLNSVTLNGERIPSAEGDNRRIQMDLVPADMIQTVEVNKAVLPDMDADAIGGSVNLVTRAAPSNLRVSGTLASGYSFIGESPIWTGSLILGNRFLNDKLGVIVSGSYNDIDYGSDNVEAVWDLDDNDDAFVEEHDIRVYQVRRVRRSLSASLDYKINDKNTIFFRSMYNWRDDWENRYRLRHRGIEPVYDANNNVIGYEGDIRRQSKGGRNTDRIDNRRLEDQRMANLSLQGEHLLGNNIRLTWMSTYARASEYRPGERYIEFQASDVAFNNNFSDPEFPTITGNAALSDFELREITEETRNTFENDWNSRIDLEIPVSVNGRQGNIKFGGRFRYKEKERDNNFFEYAPTAANEAGFNNLTSLPTTDFTDADYLAGSQYQAGVFVSPDHLGGLDLGNSALFEGEDLPSEYLAGNYRAIERITAGYGMWRQQLSDKLSFVAGLRLEHTDIEYTGNEVEDEENLIGQVTGSDSYLNILPGLHLKYDITDDFILRFAWTNTLARPNYFDLVPFRDVRLGDQELIIGNPELEPTTAMNFDLMAENYFKSIGLVSGGVFYKRLNNFIYQVRDENATNANDPSIPTGEEWQFTQPLNGDEVDVYGFELAFQRQLDFLPGIWKGLGVYLNYTYTHSDASGIRNGDGEIRDEDLALPGTAPHMFNASLSFETKKLVLRASVNFSDSYIDELGGSAFEDRYYDHQLFVDLNGSYAFTPNFRFFFEVNNLTNQPLRYFQGVSDRTMQMEYYDARFNAGLKFDLFGKK